MAATNRQDAPPIPYHWGEADFLAQRKIPRGEHPIAHAGQDGFMVLARLHHADIRLTSPIAQDPDVTSESIGDAFMKTVIISVKD